MSNGKDTSQSQGASGGASPPDGANEAESRAIIGAFIAAAGVCVMSWVIIDVCGRWPIEGLVLRPWAIVLLLAFAAGAAFVAVNVFWPMGKPPSLGPAPDRAMQPALASIDGEARKRPTKAEVERLALEAKNRDDAAKAEAKVAADAKAKAARDRVNCIRALAACGVALAIAAALFGSIAAKAGGQASFDRFALKLDLPAGAAKPLEPGAPAPPNDKAVKPDPAVEATLVWWAPRKSELSNGLLPTFLGGLFICALGVCFSRIGLTAASGSLGLGEKLLAPVVGLGLLGVGATQQIETAKMEKDVLLIERGLPPAISLPREGRDDRYAKELERRLTVVEREKLSREGAALLEEKLGVLQAQVASNQGDATVRHGLTRQAMDVIGSELVAIRNDLRRPESRQFEVKLSNADLEAMSKTVTGVESRIKKQAENRDQKQTQAHCDLLHLEQAAMAPVAEGLIKQADAKDADLARHKKTPFFDRLGKRAPKGGAGERERAAKLQDEIAALVRQQQVRCGGERLARNDR